MQSEDVVQLQDLLTALRPWFNQEHSFLIDLAKQDWGARLILAVVLLDSNKAKEACLLLESIINEPESDQPEQEHSRLRALVELSNVKMEQLKYDEAEELLWQARNLYPNAPVKELDFTKEDISLIIAQCRFGQGFIQDAIDRADEILHKLQSMDAGGTRLAKAYQQLGWFYMHKIDGAAALANMKKAMKLAPRLDQTLVDEGLAAEGNGEYEKALEAYFDCILFD